MKKILRHWLNTIAYKYKHTHVRVRGRETIQRQIKKIHPNSWWWEQRKISLRRDKKGISLWSQMFYVMKNGEKKVNMNLRISLILETGKSQFLH